jgi:hypothetical protein
MSLCLAAAGIALKIAASAFTLSWTHSVEKTRWEEDWRIAGNRLTLVEARVQGSGAGMEPPAEARLEHGYYVWRPARVPVAELVLRRADQVGDWRLCAGGRCAALGDWLGRDADPVRLSPIHDEGLCGPTESG